MKKLRKIAVYALTAMVCFGVLTGCGEKKEGFDASSEIGVISRENGSGTRGAFIELFGIEEKNADGEKIDRTTQNAVTTNSTSVMMTTVAGDSYAIGYISLGSLNDTVKPLKIDGKEATVENIKSGSYKISRPFNIVIKENISDASQDFINFIMSKDGQKVIEENGYIAVSDAPTYDSIVSSGTVKVEGSSSVSPVMEKLKEAYVRTNSGVNVQIQQNDSSTGVTSAIDGCCDIGMASRELKDSEIEKGVKSIVIAMDGIAVIVNKECPVDNLNSEMVKDIYTGKVTRWNAIVK